MTYVPVWVLQASSAATQYLGSYQHDEAIQCYSQAIRSSHLQSAVQNHGAVPQWMDPKPVRCAKIVAQHLVRRSNFPCDSVELWDRSDWWITWPRRKETWRELDPYRHTYTYMYIYMYIYVCLHIYVHIICICWSCPFLCVWMYVFLFNYPEMGSRIVSHAHININHITHVARLNHVSLGFPHGRWNNIGYLKPLAS